MKILIVYDSAFGNTGQIACVLRDALNKEGEASAIRAKDVKPGDLAGLDLLIVGSPTQKFSQLKSINNFLTSIPRNRLKSIKVAAFDTRIDLQKVNNRFLNFMVLSFGYAASPIAKKLRAKGGILVAPAEGFFVEDTKGPLRDGELQRAKEWPSKLIYKV